jgi:hypothetical protein
MAEPLSADETRRMRIVSIGMLLGVLMFLGVASLSHQMSKPGPLPIVSWFAVGFALLSPVIAAFVDRAQPDPATRRPGAPSPALSRHLIAYATLEAAGFLCAAALMVGASLLPLVAAAVPVGAMLLRFPRASNAS